MGTTVVWSCVLAFALLVIRSSANPTGTANIPTNEEQAARRCTSYLHDGHGNFKMKRKVYPVEMANFYIETIKLVRRTSFYKCEPRDETYGVARDRQTWWVDRGCEGIFEITECPGTGGVVGGPKKEPSQQYKDMQRRLGTRTRNIDLRTWDINSVEKRFGFPMSPFPVPRG